MCGDFKGRIAELSVSQNTVIEVGPADLEYILHIVLVEAPWCRFALLREAMKGARDIAG